MFMPCGCWGRGYLFLVLDCKGRWDNMPLPQTAHTWTPDPILASAFHICSRRYCHMSPCLLQVNIWKGNFGDIKAFLEIRAWKGTWDSCVGAAEDRQGFLEMAVCISQYRPRD